MKNYNEFQKAKDLINQHKYKKAYTKLKKLYCKEPHNNILKFELAKMLIKMGNIEKAQKYFEELLNTSSKYYAKLELGKLEASIGNIERARKCFEELLNTKNKDYAKLELGRLEASIRNIEKAREYFEELVNTQNDTYAKLELGRLEASVGNIEKAREYFEELLNSQNKDYAKLELGRLETSVGNVEKAREYLEELVNTQNDTYAKLELGKLEASIGNIEKARECFEELLNSQNNTYAKLELLNLNILQDNYEECLFYLNELMNYLPLNKINQYQFYLKYKLGKLGNDEKIQGYFNNQLVNYNSDNAILYIKSNLNENEEKATYHIFNDEVSISDLFYKLREKLPNVKKENVGLVDKYIFSLENNIGTAYNTETNLVEVVTICNTHNIITMYPTLSKYRYSLMCENRINVKQLKLAKK